ncbi:hypothetical protein GF339_09865, partial [candidate division KSB3 bacterium]|nr:hypothetical protein [candidate division KSB3 bacterium]MBD3324880.1 hypothetical protein [candidate division KSB3 bacterium]
ESSAPPQAFDKMSLDLQTLPLEPEDVEIFADIASQQCEFMALVLEKIRTVQDGEPTLSRPHVASLITAFRKVQSSASMLEIDALDATLQEHAAVFAHLETSTGPIQSDDVTQIAEILQHLTNLTSVMTAYSKEAHTDQQPAQSQSPPTPSEEGREANAPGARYTLRVEAERVDHLLNLVGELVISRAKLMQIGQKIRTLYEDLRTGESSLNSASRLQRQRTIRPVKKLKDQFDEIIVEFERLTNQMQDGTMRIRMVPIGHVLNRFPRMVRDLSRQAGKEVAVHLSGTETELDKTVIDIIGDPLIHIIRNAIDHGIETPEIRRQQHKPPEGNLFISAYHEGNQVIIEVKDDGQGIPIELVKQKALQQKLISAQEEETLLDHDFAYLIFHSGFSTVETISTLSGRGVGLHVVKRYLEKINGTIDLETTAGQGCTFTIKLPLTLAIIPALMIRVRAEVFAIPLIAVEEAIRILPQEIKTIETHQVIHLREKMLPLLDLVTLLDIPGFDGRSHSGVSDLPAAPDAETQPNRYGVVMSDGFQEVGVLVDELLGESDIVLKPLQDALLHVDGISGASIRGDGQVSLVIDPVSLIRLARTRIRREHRARVGMHPVPPYAPGVPDDLGRVREGFPRFGSE